MRVLIVESNVGLAAIWQAHLERQGAEVNTVSDQDSAVQKLFCAPVDVIILNVILENGSALAVADMASFRQPNARVVFVTNSSFFSDGSIFNHVPNACAFLPSETAPKDLASIVQHFAQEAPSASRP